MWWSRRSKKHKEENTMAAITTNYVYSIKTKKSSEQKIPVIHKETIEKFKKEMSKYSKEK